MAGKIIMDAVSTIANVFVDLINVMIDKLNIVMGAFGQKIPQIKRVALAEYSGLTASIAALNLQIANSARGTTEDIALAAEEGAAAVGATYLESAEYQQRLAYETQMALEAALADSADDYLNSEEYKRRLAFETAQALIEIQNDWDVEYLQSAEYQRRVAYETSQAEIELSQKVTKAQEVKIGTITGAISRLANSLSGLSGEGSELFSAIGNMADNIGTLASGDWIGALVSQATTTIEGMAGIFEEWENAFERAVGSNSLSSKYLTNLKKDHASTFESLKIDYEQTRSEANVFYSEEIQNARNVATNQIYTMEERKAALLSMLQLQKDQAEALALIDANYAADVAEAQAEAAAAAEKAAEAAMTTAQKIARAFTNAKTSMKTQLSGIQDVVLSFAESLGNIGTTIASKLVDNLTNGLTKSDFLTSMKTYISGVIIQAAVYTETMQAQMAAIGAEIAAGVASGFTGRSTSSIATSLAALWDQASKAAAAATSIINEVMGAAANTTTTTGYAGGTDYATAGYHWVGENGPERMYVPQGALVDNGSSQRSGAGGAGKTVNVTNIFNSPKAMNQVEQMAALKQSNRQLAFTGVI